MRALPVSRTDAEVDVTEAKRLGSVACDDKSLATRQMTRAALHHRNAFTLIELLVVVSIIIVLIGIALPAYQGVQNSAKKTQAKNDLLQIVTAVNAFYTEYGKYPVTGTTADAYIGPGTAPAAPPGPGTAPTKIGTSNDIVVDVLRNNTTSRNNASTVTTLNPRGIAYLQPRMVKSDASPTAGVASDTAPAPTTAGAWYDPWGSAYSIIVDTDYDNRVANPYTDAPGANPISTGVAAWSFGRNGALGGGGAANSNFAKEPGTAGSYANSNDVISWQ